MREKIISFADDAGFDIDRADQYHDEDNVIDSGRLWITERLEIFYKLAQREAFEQAAKLCESDEYYFPRSCAAAIREMAKEMK